MTEVSRPGDLPKIRAALIQSVTESAKMLDTAPAGSIDNLLSVRMTRTIAERIHNADLLLVTQQMRDAALDGARDIPSDLIPGEHAPSMHGIIAYQGGLPALGIGAPTAVSWCSTADTIVVAAWAHVGDIAAQWRLPRETGGWGMVCIAELYRWKPADLDGHHDADAARVMSLLLATWIMSAIPTVAEASETMQPGPRIGSGKRRDYPRQVKVVDLRRLARKGTDKGEEPAKRSYTHQWVVRGHWRQQPHGEGRALRRTTWVPSYVKGPEGAPFLPSETVFVWRR